MGQDILDSVHRSPQITFLQRVLQEKDVFERYLLPTQLRNLNLTEDTATKRPCRVYYTCMPRVYPHVTWRTLSLHTYYIIRNWRGLAELLILVRGNAKARSWDKQGSFSHVFFYVHTWTGSIAERVLTINAEAGRVVGEGFYYGLERGTTES